MSKISTIHDNIVTLISTYLSTYKQLPNPYIPEENPELFLTKGFGVSVGPGVRTDRLLQNHLTWKRTFTVILTKKISTTDHNIDSRETITKNLVEDHFTLVKRFDLDPQLSSSALKAEVFSDSGIQYIDVNKTRYFIMEIDLEVEYREDLNA